MVTDNGNNIFSKKHSLGICIKLYEGESLNEKEE